MEYLRDPCAIYAKSFAIIAAEAQFGALSREAQKIAARVVHACGMVEIAPDLVVSDDFVSAAKSALESGRSVLADSEMVRHGIAELAHRSATICTLNDPRARGIALASATTRSEAAVELWKPHIEGALA